MCRAEFNKTVRPFVKEFPIGARGIGFDRYELDKWADSYIAEQAIERVVAVRSLPGRAKSLADQSRAHQSKSDFEKALDLVRRGDD
jgi:hypothetical protein